MTTFWREGFWRTNAYGTTHWVDGHWVERYDWDRYGRALDHTNFARHRLAELRADRGATARFVNPNANCPVCGAAVFFYQNEHGSRVYFDELGPPWPKHPCTTSELSRHDGRSEDQTIEPSLRGPEERGYIGSLQESIDAEVNYAFWDQYGTSPWSAWRIDGRFASKTGTLLALSSLDSESTKRAFLVAKKLPRSVAVGQPVFRYKNWLSYFDSTELQPVEIEVDKLHSASEFVDRLLGGDA